MFNILFFPFWMMFLVIGLVFVFWLWAIIDCLSSRLSNAEKLLWILVIVFFHFIGALLYFIFSKSIGGKIMKTKGVKGRRLFRSRKNRMIAGVCGGIGEYFGIDPTLIRLAWALFTLVSAGAGILGYIIAWIIIPEAER